MYVLSRVVVKRAKDQENCPSSKNTQAPGYVGQGTVGEDDVPRIDGYFYMHRHLLSISNGTQKDQHCYETVSV